LTVLGLLLAAGAGRRMGTPKGLLRDRTGVPFVHKAVGVLLDGGCDAVTVVVGASAAEVAALLSEAGWDSERGVDVVVAADWDAGMGASLHTGLTAAKTSAASCALVSLVDLPDVGSAVVRRVLAASGDADDVLVRASYDGVPGHPVLLGRRHWDGVLGSAQGDKGARDYLAAHPPVLVECGDLATGRDVDRPEDL
jgi:CTP:molybdopterin cytidylyltransferase MocA